MIWIIYRLLLMDDYWYLESILWSKYRLKNELDCVCVCLSSFQPLYDLTRKSGSLFLSGSSSFSGLAKSSCSSLHMCQLLWLNWHELGTPKKFHTLSEQTVNSTVFRSTTKVLASGVKPHKKFTSFFWIKTKKWQMNDWHYFLNFSSYPICISGDSD